MTLQNPAGSPVTYDLSVEGVPTGWVNLPASVTVAAGGSMDVALGLTSDSFAAPADYGFTVSAQGDDGAAASVQGDLILQGQPVPPDPNSHGIVATITPSQATAGQGTSGQYVVQLTSTGSADDTFSLTAAGLPRGVTASFGETTIDVPPGASNFRDVPLTLTVKPGTTPGSYPFTVTATSTSDPAVTGTASGTLIVTAGGVQVTFNLDTGAPGTGFQATVKNTGTTTDTYNLALAGPAALVASLGTKQITLAPGASQVVPISTGAVDFAVQGNLNLMAMATSTTDPAIQAAATTALSIPATTGMTAEFSPASQTLPGPGMATFLLTVQNTGNTEDSYSATIMTTSGPVTVNLIGLDGSPTQSIPTFILPGLSTGEIELQVNLSAIGQQGTVTVLVKSLNHDETASPVAMAIVSTTPTPTPSPTSSPSPTPTPTPPPTPGPQIKKVQRYGYHMMPTTIVLTFTATLDPATAEDVHNYHVRGPSGHHIKVRRAVYDPVNRTVTLHFAERLSLHHPYRLTVIGTGPEGVSSTQNALLDSKAAGQPGSDVQVELTGRDLAFGHVSRKFLARYHILPKDGRPGTHPRDSRPTAHGERAVIHSTGLFTRWPSLSAHRSNRRAGGLTPDPAVQR